MARQTRDEIQITIPVVGTPPAVRRVWRLLRQLGHEDGDELVLSPGALEGERALHVVLLRSDQPDPVIPHVHLMAGWLRARESADGVAHPNPEFTIPDALIVATDHSLSYARHSAQLLSVIGETTALLESTTAGLTIPAISIQLDAGEDATAPDTNLHWLDIVTDQNPLEVETIRSVLESVVNALRDRWRLQPPTENDLSIGPPLPPTMARDAARLNKELESDDVEARVDSRMRLMTIYRRAGRNDVADGLLRAALQENSESGWTHLPTAPRSSDRLLELRGWELPPDTPAGLAFVDEGRVLIAAAGDRIYRLERTRSEPVPVADPGESNFLLRPVDDHRFLVAGQRIRVIDRDANVLCETRLPPNALIPPGGPTTRAIRLRVEVDVDSDRLLVLAAAGLYIFRLSDLTPVSRLERDDLVTAAFDSRGHVVTVHRSGTVGRWRVDTTIVERVRNLPGRLRDGALAMQGTVLATILDQGSMAGNLLIQSRNRTLEVPSLQATTIRLAPGASRLLTLEHRFLRVRDFDHSGRLSPPRTLLGPPPWMPVHVDISLDSRFIAVMARTYTGRAPLRVAIFG